MSHASDSSFSRALPLAGVASGGLVWWVIAAAFWKGNPVLAAFAPGPSLAALAHLVSSGELWPHLFASLRRILCGLGLASLAGIPIGVLIGIWNPFERFTHALFQFLRMVSPLSWMPLAVMAFGLGDLPVIFLVSIASVWPLILNTAAGVAAVAPRRLLLARSFCATPVEIVLRVVVPSILGYVLSGLRLSVGVAWIVLVPAEMLGVRAGLGYYVLDARDRLDYSELVAVIIAIGLVGYAFDSVLRAAQRRWAVLD